VNTWLIRIALDLRNRTARQDLRDIAAVHRRVMSLMPDGIGPQPRHQAGTLFRIDQTDSGPVMLVQAALRPDPGRLPEGYGTINTRDLTPLVAALRPGMLVHYRIAANASKRVWKGDQAGKVVALSGADAEDWWQRKAKAHGLSLLTLHADAQPTARGRSSEVRHAVTRFDGRAVVRDVDLVRSAVLSGIGRGKSFGCGLLSLAPIS
jgi:CRISPR system Cascade subunit CasE